MKILPTITQSFTLTPDQLGDAIVQYLEIDKPKNKVIFSWKHGSRLQGHGPMEMDVPYFEGVEVTVKP